MKPLLISTLLFITFYGLLTAAAAANHVTIADPPAVYLYPILCIILGITAAPGKYKHPRTTGQYLTMIVWAFIPGVQLAAFYFAGKSLAEE